MARELIANYQGSATIYAILRNISDDTVWNGSSFEAWNGSNIATYDVALTDRSGDLFSADMPSGISAGNYHVTYYVQAGVSPATSDYVIGTPRDFHWDGTGATSVSTVTISSYALTDLNGAKRYLDISDSGTDTILTEIINQVSAFIERVTGRNFVARDYRERFNGDWQSRLVLTQYPVQRVTRIAYGAGNALSISFTGSAIRANASIYIPDALDATGGLRLNSINSSGVATNTSLSFATYPSVSVLITAINAVSGWTASSLSNQPTRDLNPIVGGDALGRTIYATYPDQDDWVYRVDAKRGLVEFERSGLESFYGGFAARHGWDRPLPMPLGFQNLLVEYRAGYETVPYDVELLARELIRAKYYERIYNPDIKSSSLGPFSVSFSESDEQEILNKLSTYVDGGAAIAGW